MENNLIALNNRFYEISEGRYKGLDPIDHDLAESSRICVVAETPREKGLRLVEEYKLVNPEIGTINNFSSPIYPVPLAKKELLKNELNRFRNN